MTEVRARKSRKMCHDEGSSSFQCVKKGSILNESEMCQTRSAARLDSVNAVAFVLRIAAAL